MADSDLSGRVEALETQVAELKSVQDLLMRLLSTTRPLANLLRFYGATDAAEQALYQLLDELLAASRGPRPRQPTLQLLPDAAGRDFPALRAATVRSSRPSSTR